MYNFVVSTVPADGLVPLGVKASEGRVTSNVETPHEGPKYIVEMYGVFWAKSTINFIVPSHCVSAVSLSVVVLFIMHNELFN